MIRGTNAQFKFNLPYDLSEVASVKIIFWQRDYNGPDPGRPLPITKILQQCSTTDNPRELSVTLTQEETLRFTDEHKAYVQLRGLTTEDVPFASKIKQLTVYPVYDDSLFGDIILPTPSYDGLIVLDGHRIEEK